MLICYVTFLTSCIYVYGGKMTSDCDLKDQQKGIATMMGYTLYFQKQQKSIMHNCDPNVVFNISYSREIIIILMMQVFLDSFG